MRRLLLPTILVVVSACAHASPPTVVTIDTAPPEPRAERIVASAGSELRTPEFPAGPGTPLVVDELRAVVVDPRFRGASLLGRVAIASEMLGIEPIVEGDQWVFYGVGSRSSVAPYSCHALRIDAFGPTVALDDHRGCGMPYAELTPPRPAAGPRFTVNRLRDALAKDAIGWLGAPDRVQGSTATWYGVGPRDEDAPITCHALRVKGAFKEVDRAPLTECGVSWPANPASFSPRPPEHVWGRQEILALCDRCGPRDVCVLDQDTPVGAHVVERGDRTSSRYDDGQPAKLTITTSCFALPPTCADAFACARAIPCPSGDRPKRLERGATGTASLATCE